MLHDRHRATAFGLLWRSDIALCGFDPADGGGIGDRPIDVRHCSTLPDRGDGRPIPGGILFADGIRFVWGEEVVFDIRDGIAVSYRPGPAWTGALPACFYSTIAALVVAWRGLVTLHACAVEIDGKAVLIAGTTGAGKSSLTAGLVGLGARFVADDLTVVTLDEGRVRVPRGRPSIRLHRDAIAGLDATHVEAVQDDPRDKWIARPLHRQRDDDLYLGAIVLLEDAFPADTPHAVILMAHIFRPRLMAELPTRTALIRDVVEIAARVPMVSYSPQTDCHATTRRRRAEEVMTRICAQFAMSQASR